MTPETYIKTKIKEINYPPLDHDLKQALKDTWNEALKQAESVLPEEEELEDSDFEADWEDQCDAYARKAHNECRDESINNIKGLRLK